MLATRWMAIVLAAVCLICLVGGELGAQTVSGSPVLVTPAVDVTIENNAAMANEDGELPSAEGRRRLSLKERRELGITWANVHRKAKDLYQAGEISADMSRAEIAGLVFSKIASENPTAFADPMVDWDAILAFIEAILPLILQIIGLFSYVPHAAGVMLAMAPVAMPLRRRRTPASLTA